MKRFFLTSRCRFAFATRRSQPTTTSPKHGGIVMETKAGDLELVAKPERIVLHVSDHGKPQLIQPIAIAGFSSPQIPRRTAGTALDTCPLHSDNRNG